MVNSNVVYLNNHKPAQVTAQDVQKLLYLISRDNEELNKLTNLLHADLAIQCVRIDRVKLQAALILCGLSSGV